VQRAFVFTAAAMLLTAFATAASPAANFGSTATVTEQQTPPGFDGSFAPAVVLSAVNVRSAPRSQGSQIIGTLQQGESISVRCQRGWCELEEGGYAAQKFLSFSGGSFNVVQPPAEGETTGGNAVTADLTAPDALPQANTAMANFDGTWTLVDNPTQGQLPLVLAQTGTAVTGTLTGKDRVTKITGDIQGNKLTFTYAMVNGKGGAVASGNGFLNLAADGQSLSGVLMLNGLVIANLTANRG
jgi:hypothetical protein